MTQTGTNSKPLPRRLLRKLLLWVAAGGVAAAFAGCNTTEGVGRDVKSAGRGIEETAQDAKR